MKSYIRPNINILLFDEEEITTASGGGTAPEATQRPLTAKERVYVKLANIESIGNNPDVNGVFTGSMD